MDILNTKINEYLRGLPAGSPSPLDEMEQFASERNFPIIGSLVGRILQQLVVVTNAKMVFELGSGYGYSALWMAMAMPQDGRVVCTDLKDENRELAVSYFAKAGQQSKLDFRVCEAIAEFEKETDQVDFVLSDIDKDRYPDTIKLVKDRLRPGGIFVTDNLLWGGSILESSPDKETLAILKFTRELYNDPDFMMSIIPIRDGISIAVKK